METPPFSSRWKWILMTVSSFYMLLFLYTGISKLITYNTFLVDLKNNPLIENIAPPISLIIPIVEIAAAIWLFVENGSKNSDDGYY